MLGTRILSAVVLIPLVLFMLFFSPETTALLTGFGAIIGAYEFYNMAENSPRKFHPLVIPGYVLALCLILAGYFKNTLLMLAATFIIALVMLVLLFLRRSQNPDRRNSLAENWGISIFGPLYAGLPLGLVTYIRSTESDPVWWILLALVGTWGTDTGAYLVGRLIGKHKLAPKISPNKTVEGAVGGLVTGVIGVSLVGVFLLNQPLYLTIPLGIALSLGAISGDLFESWMKRRFDTKDSGKLIPGHGGILDRIDALLVVLVLTYLFILIF